MFLSIVGVSLNSYMLVRQEINEDLKGIKVRPLEWDAHDFEDIMERFAVMVAVRSLPLTRLSTSLPLKHRS
jgi:hypothetical protein